MMMMMMMMKKKIDWDKPKKGLLNSINAISQTIIIINVPILIVRSRNGTDPRTAPGQVGPADLTPGPPVLGAGLT